MEILDDAAYRNALPALCELFESAFQRPLDPDDLVWRYLDNPAGDLLVAVASDGDRLAANYSASPVVLARGGYQGRTGLSMTTMTSPKHRGRGYFQDLALRLMTVMTERGYDAIWGFPNLQSHAGFVQRLGWSDVYEIPTMRRALDGSTAQGEPWRSDDAFALDYLLLAHGDLLHGVRTREHLRWRYGRHPSKRYRCFVLGEGQQVRSYVVLKEFGPGVDIVDLQAHDREDARELVDHVLQFARVQGATEINTWAPRHHFSHGIYEKLGFVHREPITYLGVRALRETPLGTPRELADFSSWYLQMGDSDVY